MRAIESDWYLSVEDTAAVTRSDGVIQGTTLANYLHAEGRLDKAFDAVTVQTTRVRGQQYVLGIDSDGHFRWVEDVAGLGDMETVSANPAENEQNFVEALEYVEARNQTVSRGGLKP